MGRLQCSPYSSEYRPDLANNKLEFALFAKVIQRWLLAEQSVTAKCLPLLLVVLSAFRSLDKKDGLWVRGDPQATESGHQVSLISKALRRRRNGQNGRPNWWKRSNSLKSE